MFQFIFFIFQTRKFKIFLKNYRVNGKQIVSAVTTQLSWTHFFEVLPLEPVDAKLYYCFIFFISSFISSMVKLSNQAWRSFV